MVHGLEIIRRMNEEAHAKANPKSEAQRQGDSLAEQRQDPSSTPSPDQLKAKDVVKAQEILRKAGEEASGIQTRDQGNDLQT